MRKKVQPDTICKECGTKLKHGKEERFCDLCKQKAPEALELTVFFKGHEDTQRVDLCSWKCVFKWLRECPSNKRRIQFITLPYIAMREKTSFADALDNMLKAFKDAKE